MGWQIDDICFHFVMMVVQVLSCFFFMLLKFLNLFFKDGTWMIPEMAHPSVCTPESLSYCALSYEKLK